MLKKYAGSTSGKYEQGDKKNCAVKAIAFAFGIPYKVALDALNKKGRRWRDGTKQYQIDAVIKSFAAYAHRQITVHRTYGWNDRKPKVGTVVGDKGTYIVSTCNHTFTVIDGIQADHRDNSRCYVTDLYKIGEWNGVK